MIEPCKVLTYDGSTTIGTMIYSIGDLDMSTQYFFDESPVCNYLETVIVIDLPAFMIHNEGSSQITIPQTNDNSFVGIYTVTVRSEI